MNKQSIITFFLIVLMSMTSTKSLAYDISVANSDGIIIYYNFANNHKELEVTFKGRDMYTGSNTYYSDYIKIPESVEYKGEKYTVTGIGYGAFNWSVVTEVTIPNTVTYINEYAFYKSYIKRITIPNSVKEIYNFAFYDCSMSSVIFGLGLTLIESRAFENAKIKKAIWLTNRPPSGYEQANGEINYVSNNQFTSLTNVVKYEFLSSYFGVDGIIYVPTSPSDRICDAVSCVYDESAAYTKIVPTVEYKGIKFNVRNIKPYLAHGNEHIKTLTVDNVVELPDYTFANCINLKNVTLGESISSIGKYAFADCTSLETIKIPDNVTILNEHIFDGCTSLKELKIGSKVKTIDNYAFSKCYSLASITIPMSVTKIYDSVFWQCKGLKKVIIADGEDKINLDYGGYAIINKRSLFSDCPLDYVYIGRDISYGTGNLWGYSPFYCNTTLREVKITDKETEISENEFQGCSNLQKITIGDGVTTIGYWAFSGCLSLNYFEFGSRLQTIGAEAFSDCTKLAKLVCRSTNPPACGSQALNDINKWECILYVPNGSLSSYKNAAQWKEFFFIEEGFANGISNVKVSDFLIHSKGNQLIINNVDEGTAILVYDQTGKLVGSSKASAETTIINTTLRSGDIGIVKIGDKSVKVLMK